jgi:hypothetical protein
MNNEKLIVTIAEPKDSPPPIAAVAVVLANAEHTGIVYVDVEGNPIFLHLADHHKLTRDSLDGKTGWVVAANISAEALASVAAMCERVWIRQGSKIPYGFRYDMTRFDVENGSLVLGKDEVGLTCATFVLAVFSSIGLEVLARTSWPEREDDTVRWQKLATYLEKTCDDKAHVVAVKQQVNAKRFRPLEVAGGSRHVLPTSYEQAIASAAQLSKELVGA